MELKSAIKKLHGAFGRNGVDTGAFGIVDKEELVTESLLEAFYQ